MNPLEFVFDEVQFFGRDFAEYTQMFNLTPESLSGKSVLDCPGGPSTFGQEARQLGVSVTSCDPQYEKSSQELQEVFERQLNSIASKVTSQSDVFDPGKPQLDLDARKQLLAEFLFQFSNDAEKRHYVPAKLPILPFTDNNFDLALSGNLLFMYSDPSHGGILRNSSLDFDFHLKSIIELLRVAREARIYPIKGAHAESIPFLPHLLDELKRRNYTTSVEHVGYRDLKGAHHMLRVTRT